LADHLTIRKFFRNFLWAHVQCAKGREASVYTVVGDFFRMELLIDPLIDANGHHFLYVSGTRTEREAVQGVHSALLLVGSGDTRLFFLFRKHWRHGAGQTRANQQRQGTHRVELHGPPRVGKRFLIMNPNDGKSCWRAFFGR
jgi:hypothetical protein